MPWPWISAPLMCSDSLPCSCCVYIALGFVNVAEGWAPSTAYQHVCRSDSACSHQSPLRHELRSDCHLCLSARPNAIGCELPVASPTCLPHPFAYIVNYVSAFEGGGQLWRYSSAVVHLSIPGLAVAQSPNLPGIAGMGCPTPAAALNAFLTGVSTEVWLDTVRRVSGFAPLTAP